MMGLLHLLEPETAHGVTLAALKLGLGPVINEKRDIGLELFGRKIRNPIGLPAGADKKAEALAGWSRMGFGLVEAGTVCSAAPRAGNPRPRLWRFKPQRSLINWMGLPGPGIDVFAANLQAFQSRPERQHLTIGVSLASSGGRLEEFTQLAKTCAPYADYLTLNVSCVNVADATGHDAPEQAAARQIKACKEGAGSRPVLLKPGPAMDGDVLRRMADAALEAGVDGFVATNTLPHAGRALAETRSIDWPMRDGAPVGGYSGPGLLPISCWMVKELRARAGAGMPIIGVGGVQGGADALRLLKAGADAIQLYTGLVYKGPGLIREIMDAIAAERG